ncbi:MAG: GGDEF domain-containing protein [Oleiphilus sp.]|nr:MAG: GGDEF domain-containing protein [Oleiphilus sp.]
MGREITISSEDANKPAHSLDRTSADQALRLQRLSMSFRSYLFTFTLVCFCWFQGMIAGSIVFHYGAFVLLLNLCFFALIKTGHNLRYSDPSMTFAQIITSIIPAMYVMYFLDSGHVRSVFLYLGIVPALYGILGLNTRQFIKVAVWYVIVFSTMLSLLLVYRPTAMNLSLEVIQLLALILVMSQMAWIGGYINKLRSKLRKRNIELQSTTKQLEEALEQLGEVARRDELTGLYNRRHLFEVLDQERNRVHRKHETFSVCIADIDFFKQVNDTHGHQVGDQVLRKVAHELNESLRNIDCIGRYGGEEFLIVLPQTALNGAIIKAERFRQHIENLSFSSDGESFQVTLSIGLAEHKLEESVDDTIQRADEALYRAKNSGRNRTVSEQD